MGICFLALAVGVLLPFVVPAVQFALGLLVTAVCGVAIAWFIGHPIREVAAWGAILFVCAQVGFGIGVGAITAYRIRRGRPRHAHDATRPSMPASLRK